MQITVIKQNNNIINYKKKVAAYARVSTNSDSQEESFDSQVSYYKNLILNNSNYEYVNVYADFGISGTQSFNRPEFNKLINDAMNKKIDIIYCKSISRFCRNASECQKIVRELKQNLVEVIFEKEQLSSFNPMSEMVFNFMTIIAQEESRSISENTIWALDKLAEKGIRKIGNNKVFGYDEINGKLIPNSNSKAIKIIFNKYSKGIKVNDIINHLTNLGYMKIRTKTPFTRIDIIRMINNVIYKGDRIIQKFPHRNYITKKYDYTREFNQYYITDSHKAIVSKDLWDKCQRVKKNKMKKKK